jgi:hypothetical protein
VAERMRNSYFHEIHAKSDHLMRFMSPEFKEKCTEKCVHLIHGDLHGGVTEADAHNSKTLDICLDEIDSCR